MIQAFTDNECISQDFSELCRYDQSALGIHCMAIFTHEHLDHHPSSLGNLSVFRKFTDFFLFFRLSLPQSNTNNHFFPLMS